MSTYLFNIVILVFSEIFYKNKLILFSEQETEINDQKLQSVHELSLLEMETSKYLLTYIKYS